MASEQAWILGSNITAYLIRILAHDWPAYEGKPSHTAVIQGEAAVAVVSRLCTHFGHDNQTVDHCWDLHGRPVAHQAVVVFEADVNLFADEYQRLLAAQSSITTTLAQTSASITCVATHIPWVIDFGAFSHDWQLFGSL
ncbi:hypothetical protein Acr_25g0001810 [Actinidia rufa]|uniref:Uncharacterized protein n=1 Tax=Actinidia rufa TaxID=165716 RepID=A0A7J0GY98_9ERIC|nr:hypothetical protein Acr_25g0001810 [Actinidia rufa]